MLSRRRDSKRSDSQRAANCASDSASKTPPSSIGRTMACGLTIVKAAPPIPSAPATPLASAAASRE